MDDWVTKALLFLQLQRKLQFAIGRCSFWYKGFIARDACITE